MTHTNIVSYIHLWSTAALITLLGACSTDEPTVILNSSGKGGSLALPSAGSGGGGGSSGTSNEPACIEEPEAPAEFLARCTESTCRPFDNVDRLRLYRAGQRLPEAP